MKRIGYLLLVCLLVFGMGTFAGAETEVMQEDFGAYAPGAITGQAISDGSFIREVYSAVPPADSETFLNEFATRVFTAGQTINLYGRYTLDSERSYTGYWIVANGGGQIAYFNSFTSANSGGVNARSTNVSLEPGTYLLQLVIIGDGVTMISPNPFVFVVE